MAASFRCQSVYVTRLEVEPFKSSLLLFREILHYKLRRPPSGTAASTNVNAWLGLANAIQSCFLGSLGGKSSAVTSTIVNELPKESAINS